jgi:predicted Zn-dependent peptidase
MKGFNLLVFETEQWQYVFSINKDVSEVTPETLVQFANAIDF